MSARDFFNGDSMEIVDVKIEGDRSNIIEEFTLCFENDTSIKFGTGADCCSYSWIEKIHQDFESLIGKKIIGIVPDTEYVHTFSPSGVQDYDLNLIYKFILDDNEEFIFAMRNSSNGYYSGWLTIH